MNETEFGVFIIKYQTGNTYAEKAFLEAKISIAETGFVEVLPGVYVVCLRTAIRTFLSLYAQDAARSERRLQFVLLPCGAHTFGELPQSIVEELKALGLSHSDTEIPAIQPRH